MTPDRITFAQALASALGQGLARLDAQLLMLHVLGRHHTERAWLLAHDGDAVSGACMTQFDALVSRRAAGEPLAYLVGSKEFFGLNFQVDARVLIPRPDTETLVRWALDQLDEVKNSASGVVLQRALNVLDLGTGSGAVALAIAHGLGQRGHSARLVAVDASADALAVAQGNHGRLGSHTNVSVEFLESNWFARVSGQFDLIVSNPPYIASGDPHLVDLAHEPISALVAGQDGLRDLREIIDTAPGFLLPGGWLMLEHGYDQPADVQSLLGKRGFGKVNSRADLAGIFRCTGGQWPG